METSETYVGMIRRDDGLFDLDVVGDRGCPAMFAFCRHATLSRVIVKRPPE